MGEKHIQLNLFLMQAADELGKFGYIFRSKKEEMIIPLISCLVLSSLRFPLMMFAALKTPPTSREDRRENRLSDIKLHTCQTVQP